MTSVESTLPNPNNIVFYDDKPPFLKYFGQESFFGGEAPIAQVWGKLCR